MSHGTAEQSVRHTIMAIATVLLLCGATACGLGEYPRVELHEPGSGFDQPIENPSPREAFSFLILNDIHFGRPDSGVYRAHEEFWTWLDQYQITAPLPIELALNLGDFTDDSQESQYIEYAAFVDELESRQIPTHTVVGNHDVRNQGRTYFASYVNPLSSRRISHKGISFYLLDTGNRSLGKSQVDDLAEQTNTDANLKLFCSHIPLYGGPGLFYFALPDFQERSSVLSTMVQSKAGLYLSGHHHAGDVAWRFSEVTAEFIFGAFHGRDSLFESTLPRWYVGTFDPIVNTIRIMRYAVGKDSVVQEDLIETFAMPSIDAP